MSIGKRTYFFIGIFLITVVLNSLGVVLNNNTLVFLSVPLGLFWLIVMYVVLGKELNVLFLIYLFVIFVAEFLLLFKDSYFYCALLVSVVAQIILVKLIIGFRHINFYRALVYFIITLFGYIVIYVYVIDIEREWVILLYGFVNSLLVSLGMSNYLRKMYWANYLLFLGVAFWVLNNAILSLNVFDVNANLFGVITNSISHFFICMSFVVRGNKLPEIKKVD